MNGYPFIFRGGGGPGLAGLGAVLGRLQTHLIQHDRGEQHGQDGQHGQRELHGGYLFVRLGSHIENYFLGAVVEAAIFLV